MLADAPTLKAIGQQQPTAGLFQDQPPELGPPPHPLALGSVLEICGSKGSPGQCFWLR